MKKFKFTIVLFAVIFFCKTLDAKSNQVSVGIEMPVQLPVAEATEEFLKDVGIDYINFYTKISPAEPNFLSLNVTKTMVDLCEKLDLDFSISTHRIFPEPECIDIAKKSKYFKGVVFDELAHISVINSNLYHISKDFCMIKEPNKINNLHEAYDATYMGYLNLRKKYEEMNTSVVATHIWPILNHVAAKAGLTPCPKICKELYSPVSLSLGLGAAKQYGTELWVDCDLWYYALVPGHGSEEFKSNLLLAYWLGADRIYIEGSGFNLHEMGKQGVPFSMMKLIHDKRYQLTEHGEVLKWFCRTYIPEHPRPWTFRDIVPDVVIIRKDDTCHGQRFGNYFPDHLFGVPTLHSTPDTEAWLGLWNLLTYHKTGSDGLTYFKGGYALPDFEESGWSKDIYGTAGWESYASRPFTASQHSFFAPLNGAVVYDHTANYELIKDAKLIFVTGIEVTESTMKAIKRCVKEGAICIGWHNLMKEHGFELDGLHVKTIEYGKGQFVITDDFENGEVYGIVAKYLNTPNEISYRFGNNRVILRKITENKVEVNVIRVK